MSEALVRRGADGAVTVTASGLAAIEQCAANGCANATIARVLGTSTKAFAGLLKDDGDPAVLDAYTAGKGRLADECVSTLLTHMRNGNVTACIFACKSLLGMRDNGPHTAPVGTNNALQVNITIPAPMSDAEFYKLIDVKKVEKPQ